MTNEELLQKLLDQYASDPDDEDDLVYCIWADIEHELYRRDKEKAKFLADTAKEIHSIANDLRTYVAKQIQGGQAILAHQDKQDTVSAYISNRIEPDYCIKCGVGFQDSSRFNADDGTITVLRVPACVCR